jgi:2-polyprenyl-3-methyl-5-hydroxy-6-metoxy-1,4-benzoquinol methylase
MPACIACDAENWAPFYDSLLRCRNCGFIRAAHLPAPGELARIYSSDYFAGEEYGDYLADAAVHTRNFEVRVRDMRRLAPKMQSTFEIGCAYGLFLAAATRANLRNAGIDVCEAPVRYAVEELQQNAVSGDFLAMPLAPGEYDSFCMWDTIEHLPHPEAYLARIRELLPPGGWLFLTTGDIGSLVARLRGRRWRMIHPPTHLQYFSRASLSRFLQRSDLRVVESGATGMYRTLHSLLSGLSVLGKGPFRPLARTLHKYLPARLQNGLGACFNLGDILFVAAQKKG